MKFTRKVYRRAIRRARDREWYALRTFAMHQGKYRDWVKARILTNLLEERRRREL